MSKSNKIAVAAVAALLMATPTVYANAHGAGSEAAQPGAMQGGQGAMMQDSQPGAMQGGQRGMGMMNMMAQMNQMMAACAQMMKTMSKHFEKEAAPDAGTTN